MNVKSFFVLFFIGLLILSVAGGAISDTDLTPDTPPASNDGNVADALAPVVQGASSETCGGAYTVRSGDTLSAIAHACSLTLANLLAANPQINNPDLIHLGQQINVPRSAAPVVSNDNPAPQPAVQQAVVESAPQPTQVVVEAAPPAVQTPTSTPDAIFSAFETARSPEEGSKPAAAPTPRPAADNNGLKPGSLVQVSVAGFPANVPVSIGIGQVGKDPFFIDESVTNDRGVATVIVAVPANARSGQKWTVTIATINTNPSVTETAVPFIIGN